MNRIRARLRWLRWTVVWLGYRIRPYDMIVDGRRWRWQKPAPCGYQQARTLTPEQYDALMDAIRNAQRVGDEHDR